MMWQLYALMAIGSNCLENITDKRAMRRPIDPDVASLIRVALYCVLVVPISAVIGQPATWFCSPGIIASGLSGAFIAAAYTLVMKRVDVTALSVLSYTAPLIFLVIDNAIGYSFTMTQVLGIIGLVIGGIGFALNGRLKLDAGSICLLFLMLSLSGGQSYYLQHLHKTEGLSAISFYANVWGWAGIFLAINVLARGKWSLLLSPDALAYAKLSTVAKSFDSLTSVFAGMALTMTTVAQFSSMEVFYPPMMLCFACIAQQVMGIDLGEQFDKHTMGRKVSMAGILLISGIYV